MKQRDYRVFYVAAVLGALINFPSLDNLNARQGYLAILAPLTEGAPRDLPIVATAFAVAYCLIMPRKNLLTAFLVVAGLVVAHGVFLSIVVRSADTKVKLAAGITGVLVCSLTAPMTLGLGACPNNRISLDNRK